jgi:uncharacterized protein YndB with AHSA1/START domain
MFRFGVSLLLVAASLFGSSGEENPVKLTKTSLPHKRLDFEVNVPGSVDEVWRCFSTREGMITWITPDAQVEMHPGGVWLAKYPGLLPGGGRIVSFEPEQFLALHAMAPEEFPTVRREGTTAVFTFIAVDEHHTTVHLSQVGWKSGEEWDRAYEHLSRGNVILLTQLRDRFLHGPVNWAEELKSDKQS